MQPERNELLASSTIMTTTSREALQQNLRANRRHQRGRGRQEVKPTSPMNNYI